MRGKLLGDVSKGPQARGATVEQAQVQAKLLGKLEGFMSLGGAVPEGATADFQG